MSGIVHREPYHTTYCIKYAEDSGMLAKLKFDINGDDFREGLTAVV